LNYQFPVGMATDDFVEAEQVDRLARTADRLLGALTRWLLAGGVYSGWEIGADKTVGAGCGLVSGCWGETAGAQTIGGLTSGAVNYVLAVATAQSAPAGAVEFAAQTNPAPPPEAVLLGTLELDSSGAVVALDNQAAGVSRGAFALRSATLRGNAAATAVGAGASVALAVAHEALAVPGAIAVSVNAPFTYTVEEIWRTDGFLVRVTNAGAEAADLALGWERRGLEG
jgi:hypothetical protein